jgi:two-component system, OmpR family, response regulator
MADLQRILYVEDEPDIQQVAEVALEMVGGFTLNTCSSGEEAMKEAVAFKPELFLLDVMMPGMDGPTTLKALREEPSLVDIPVIFMTAKVQPSEVVELKSLGAIAVIPKPFDPMELANQIRTIWQQHYDR